VPVTAAPACRLWPAAGLSAWGLGNHCRFGSSFQRRLEPRQGRPAASQIRRSPFSLVAFS
jgi:hypothetical protein